MNNSRQVDEIVRLVVERLRSGVADDREPAAEVMELQGSIVSLRDVEGRLDGIERVRVAPTALLTPAVQDELRRHGVAVERGGMQHVRAVNQPRIQLASPAQTIQVFASPERLASLSSVGKNGSIHVNPCKASIAETVTDICARRHASAGQSEMRFVWWTALPFAASAAIHAIGDGLRLACLHDPMDLGRAIDEMQPNLILLDDRHWPAYQVVKVLRTWSTL